MLRFSAVRSNIFRPLNKAFISILINLCRKRNPCSFIMKSPFSIAPTKRQMSSQKLSPNCPGCGAEFQNKNESKAGFLPPMMQEPLPLSKQDLDRIQQIEASPDPITPQELKLLLRKKKEKKKVILCMRCHALQKSGKRTTTSLKTNRRQFSDLKSESGGLVILMMDLMDLHNSVIQDITDFIGRKRVIILLNKADLMPPKFKFDNVQDWVRQNVPVAALAYKIFPISAATGQGMDTVASLLLESKENIYLVGCTNAGKSTFMNYWKKKAGHDSLVTTSITSGTTTGLVKIPIQEIKQALVDEIAAEKDENTTKENLPERVDKETFLIDTAGIIMENQMSHLFSFDQLKYLSPSAPLKNHTIQLNGPCSFWIGGIIRIDLSSPSQQQGGKIIFELAPKLKVYHARLGKKPNPGSDKNQLVKLPRVLWVDGVGPKINLLSAGEYLHNPKNVYWISGIGWFRLTSILKEQKLHVAVYSPLGRGITVKELSI